MRRPHCPYCDAEVGEQHEEGCRYRSRGATVVTAADLGLEGVSAPRLFATHTPSWETFRTVTVGIAAAGISAEVELSPAEAVAHAVEVLRSAGIVLRDQAATP